MMRMCPFAISLEQPVFADFHCGARKEAKIQKHSCTGASGLILKSSLSHFELSKFSSTKFDN